VPVPRRIALRRAPDERRVAGEHLVGDASQGVDVRPDGDLALAHRLLGRHVVRRAETHPGLGHPVAAGAGDGERDTEVRDQRGAVVQQDVFGLDIPMDHTMAVGVVQRGRHFRREPEGVRYGELLLASQSVAEALPFDERHHIPGRAIGFATVDEPEDVGVLQGGDGLDLAQEPLGANDRGQFRPEDLDRDLAVVAQVLRQVDGGHAALAELPLDAVAVGQGGDKGGPGLGHR
jgi:hypothetical protein